jgi:hypothetical protein
MFQHRLKVFSVKIVAEDGVSFLCQYCRNAVCHGVVQAPGIGVTDDQ